MRYCTVEVINSLNHSFSSSIKPFAQPPYPSLSGPVPQSIASKYKVKKNNIWFKDKNINSLVHGYVHMASRL